MEEKLSKERLEECLKIAEALSDKPTERDLRQMEAKKFDELLETLEGVITEYKVELLAKFFKKIGKVREGYHEKFMETANRIIKEETESMEEDEEMIEYMLATSNDS